MPSITLPWPIDLAGEQVEVMLTVTWHPYQPATRDCPAHGGLEDAEIALWPRYLTSWTPDDECWLSGQWAWLERWLDGMSLDERRAILAAVAEQLEAREP